MGVRFTDAGRQGDMYVTNVTTPVPGALTKPPTKNPTPAPSVGIHPAIGHPHCSRIERSMNQEQNQQSLVQVNNNNKTFTAHKGGNTLLIYATE